MYSLDKELFFLFSRFSFIAICYKISYILRCKLLNKQYLFCSPVFNFFLFYFTSMLERSGENCFLEKRNLHDMFLDTKLLLLSLSLFPRFFHFLFARNANYQIPCTRTDVEMHRSSRLGEFSRSIVEKTSFCRLVSPGLHLTAARDRADCIRVRDEEVLERKGERRDRWVTKQEQNTTKRV